jgi:TIR domain/Pentapeptide repeats (8 copies)
VANLFHLERLRKGKGAWNEWRRNNLIIEPDLSSANLSGANLSGADFGPADLVEMNLRGARLSGAILVSAKLSGANLAGADLRGADLRSADFSGANLYGANFKGATLAGANFDRAYIGDTVFTAVDLSQVRGMERVVHSCPSEISVSTIYLSGGKIPYLFLRGCGVPEAFIAQVSALVTAVLPIELNSCFVSYSSKDDPFARRLYMRMREAGLRVWFAAEDMKGGDKLRDQIDRAIQVHDRLLLVLSENSLQSKWVELEIRRARKVELRENRRKLFPIRLVSYEALQEWVCIDSTTGEDLAEEVRSYFIPDFSNWKNHDDFEQAFARLLADLKASA